MTHQGNTCFCRSLLLGLIVLWSWSGMVATAEEPTETNLDLSALIREKVLLPPLQETAYVFTFHQEGLFSFYCTMHQPEMSGQILVLPAKPANLSPEK
jgi:plastocyanin